MGKGTLLLTLWSLASVLMLEGREKRQAPSGPNFSQSTYTFCVQSLNQGASVGQVALSSPGSGQSFFSFPSGSSTLAIDPASGQMYLSTTLQPDAPQSSVMVQIIDMAGRSDIATVLLQTGMFCSAALTSPSTTGSPNQLAFPQSSYQFQLVNCQFGTFIGQAAVPSSSSVSYAMNPFDNNIQLFPNNGMMYLIGTIDGSTKFNLLATSSTGQSASVPVTVTNSCNALTSAAFSQTSYVFTPPSCRFGATVGKVATNGGAVMFYGVDPASSSFTIEGGTGNVIASSNISQGNYTVTIRLFDQTLLPTPMTAAVTVLCPAVAVPVAFPQASYNFGPVCKSGTFVGTVSLTNSPTGTQYLMMPPQTGIFNLSPATGQITLVNAPGTSPLHFTVRATFPGGVAMVPVSVTTCSRPSFTLPQYVFQPSSCAAGTLLGQVAVKTPSRAIRFSLGPGSLGFAVDIMSGWVRTTRVMMSNSRTVLPIVAIDSTTGQATQGSVVVQGNCGSDLGGLPDFG